MADNIAIGKIVKPHGYKGDLTLRVNENYEGILQELDFIFVELDGDHVPYPFDILADKNKGHYKVHLLGVDDEKTARSISGKAIFAPEDLVNKIVPEHDEESSFDGFLVVDTKAGDLGTVVQFSDFGGNQILELQGEGEDEILIPIHPDFIVEIDPEKEIIYTDLPAGIVDLNE